MSAITTTMDWVGTQGPASYSVFQRAMNWTGTQELASVSIFQRALSTPRCAKTWYYRTVSGSRGNTMNTAAIPAGAVVERVTDT